MLKEIICRIMGKPCKPVAFKTVNFAKGHAIANIRPMNMKRR